ncbi:MAG TPA: hypothetical protein VLE96_04805 [Chlamydiales bacterium]|nr:hypothetical protein [Chlamydiales bacterium]
MDKRIQESIRGLARAKLTAFLLQSEAQKRNLSEREIRLFHLSCQFWTLNENALKNLSEKKEEMLLDMDQEFAMDELTSKDRQIKCFRDKEQGDVYLNRLNEHLMRRELRPSYSTNKEEGLTEKELLKKYSRF